MIKIVDDRSSSFSIVLNNIYFFKINYTNEFNAPIFTEFILTKQTKTNVLNFVLKRFLEMTGKRSDKWM